MNVCKIQSNSTWKNCRGPSKKIIKLEAQVKPSTPPYVVEEISMTAAEAVKKIEEVEALCAKSVEQVSKNWETLIDVVERLHTIEIEETQLKNQMKNFPLAEKMDKATKMKKL